MKHASRQSVFPNLKKPEMNQLLIMLLNKITQMYHIWVNTQV